MSTAPLVGDRVVSVVGVRKQGTHATNCRCEACGPLFAVLLTEYEAVRLLEALERRDGSDTGDWHAQIRMKLTAAIGPDNLPELNRCFGVTSDG